MQQQSSGSEANGPLKPAKAVASDPPPGPNQLRDRVWALAYACSGDRQQADRVQAVFGRAASDGGHALLFRAWWQQKTLAPLPPTTVVAPWATQIHQQIAERLADWRLLGDQPLLLACPGCGRVYTSNPPRFARSCGRCKPSQPTGKPAPHGTRLMHSPGFYKSGPAGPRQGQSLLCAHPDCLTLFLAISGQQRYCPTHQKDRESAARARRRAPSPKHQRLRFYPHERPLQISLTAADGRQQPITITPSGYQARNEAELLQLLQLRNTGHLTHSWTS